MSLLQITCLSQCGDEITVISIGWDEDTDYGNENETGGAVSGCVGLNDPLDT